MEKVVLTKNEKQNALQQICKNICNIIVYSSLENKDIKMLSALIKTYFDIKHDFEIPITFVENLGVKGQYHMKRKTIELDIHYSKSSRSVLGDMDRLAEVIEVLHHELAHYMDHADNDATNKKRNFIAGRRHSLSAIIHAGLEDKNAYFDPCFALYMCDRSEVFARQKSALDTIEFLDNLQNNAFEMLRANKKLKQIFSENNFEDALNLAIQQSQSIETYQLVNALICLNHAKMKAQHQIQADESSLMFFKLQKTYFLPKLREIFFHNTSQFFEAISKNEKYEFFTLKNIQNAIGIPEFYDDEIANKVYEIAKNTNNLNVLKELANLECFKMPKEERLKYKDIEIHRKNKAEEIDIPARYKSWKQHKLSKNTLER